MNTLIEGHISGLHTEEAFFVSVHSNGAVVGAGMRSPGRPVHLGDLPDAAIPDLARALSEQVPDAPGVNGTPDTALAVARQWQALRGRAFRLGGQDRLYRLGDLRVPSVPGAARRAVDSDLDLCVRWARAMDEVGRTIADPGVIAARIALGRWWLWEYDDHPVAMAAHQARAIGWTRIGPVYTPPEQRSHGYASALTAHVSKALRASGSQVCLFTDLSNPTSNKIYQAIGYEPVRDFANYEFE